MSAQELESATPPAWPMLRAMVGLGLLCGLLIVSVYQATLPTIRRNQAAALRRAIFQVLPEARAHATFRWVTEPAGFERLLGDGAGEGRVYAGYDEDQRLVGLAVEAAGMGYQDVIRLLYGYSFASDAIVGVRVLESRETPGLGDRIETDPDFQANFRALDVSLAAGLERIAHAIEAVGHGEKEHPWQVDGITGATISSEAIASILARSTALWIPRLRRRLDDFRLAEPLP